MTTPIVRSTLPELLAGLLLALVIGLWSAALLGLGPEPLAWTFSRLSGVAGYAALAASVALGALMGNRLVPAWLAKPLQYGWHGILAGAGLAATVAHLAFVMVDARYPQTPLGVLVPGAATYAPFALALGTLALYAMVTVQLSFANRKRLAARTWRALHLLAYPAFALATGHAVLAGSDALPWLYLPALALVGGTTALRFLERRTLLT